jgi:hypothetical protein
MTGRVVMDAYGSAAGFVRPAPENLTLSRRPAKTAPADPCPTASCIDDLSPPPDAPAPMDGTGGTVGAACAPPPVRKRVEVAEP